MFFFNVFVKHFVVTEFGKRYVTICTSGSILYMLIFLLTLPFIKMCYVYLAIGSDPSEVVVESSGPPGGVGSRARRLGRI